MTPAALVFADAERRLVEYAQALAKRLDAGEQDTMPEYRATVDTLKRLVGEAREPLMTTKQAAEKFGISPRTVRKRGKRLGLEEIRLGARGRSAIRWRA
jgi:hypothetical protein